MYYCARKLSESSPYRDCKESSSTSSFMSGASHRVAVDELNFVHQQEIMRSRYTLLFIIDHYLHREQKISYCSPCCNTLAILERDISWIEELLKISSPICCNGDEWAYHGKSFHRMGFPSKSSFHGSWSGLREREKREWRVERVKWRGWAGNRK